MSRNKLLKIIRYLRFDDKSTRCTRVMNDKFCMIRKLWDRFIKNSKACYIPNQHLTVDEQLLPSKTRCTFIHYMPNKSDKFGIKSWILSEVKSKYTLNGFPYLVKDTDRPENQLQGEYVVHKLIEPYYNKGYCVTADNFFNTIRLAEELMQKKTTLIGTIRKNRPELPSVVNSKRNLYDTIFFENEKGCTLIVYQSKKDKSVNLLSSFHEKVSFDSSLIKKIPNVVYSYNKTKVGVDTVDNMTKMFNFESIAGFCTNVLTILKSKDELFRKFCQEILEKVKDSSAKTSEPKTPITPSTPSSFRKRVANSATMTTPPSSKNTINSDRKKCQVRLCNENKSKFTCKDCGKTTCGKCLHEMVVRAMCKRCHDSKSK
ncbi:unnamed protein product [Brachionus calyciflorus]|uniref:PiggyBac transposable element-derived protein domain-containing protein n=1 Tax=Brachionus calyciflorus TaxID=104777 RepID=A0A814BKX1_9BILA|nr:unnamed protein product [Brachionus calyciflorus]